MMTYAVASRSKDRPSNIAASLLLRRLSLLRAVVLFARDLLRHCRLSEPVETLLRDAVNRLGLSARAYHRVLKIARPIADLAGAEELATAHVAEAIQYRIRGRVTMRRAATAGTRGAQGGGEAR